jgi:hypothetical protein
MHMKKSIMLGVWMMAATLLVAQHHSKSPERNAEKQAEKMKTELSLNDVQYASIKNITEKYADKQRVLGQDSTLARSEKSRKHESMRTDREKEINAVLTPEQKTKWSAYKDKQAEKRRERIAESQVKHAARQKSVLSLSDEQQAKMQGAEETFKQRALQIRDESKDDRHEAIRKLKADHEATVKTILDENQFAKWKELNAKNHGRQRSKHK